MSTGVGLDPTKPRPKKAKLLRMERKLAKRSQGGADAETLQVSVTVIVIIVIFIVHFIIILILIIIITATLHHITLNTLHPEPH